MGIGVQRNSDATVAEPLAHNPGMDAPPQRKRGTSMPQVMKSNPVQPT